jgi:hypothetical protein
MKWIKKGLIFKVENNHDWMQTHAQVPIVDKIDEERLRIYFGTRDKLNRTVTIYIEVEADNPLNILYIHDKPVLGLGEPGCFDDSGAMPSWIVNLEGVKYLYYTGWNVGTTVPYRNSIGLAISNDNGQTFTRLYDGPIMDRTYSEPYFCATPCVIIENGIWRMWYLSCVKWEVYNDKSEPYHHIKYADSTDGINWDRRGIICIDSKSSKEAGIVRPSTIKENGIYRMWYSYRGIKDYRTDKEYSYRIGYAESFDGIKWIRKDEIVGIDVSETGWDSVMVAYPYVYEHKGRKYMIYNGNGFGKSGFGYAILNEA